MVDTAEPQLLSTRSIANTLAAAILAKRQERLQARVNEAPWKPRRHYASNLNGCARNLVYAITHYQERERFTVEGMQHMEDGNHEERLLIQELVADGFDIVEQQVQMDDDRYWVTGKIDGKIRWQGVRIPFECKRISEYALDKVNSVDDMRSDPYLIDKVRQLTLYLFLHSIDAGLFILSDGRGQRKLIVVPLDYEFAETILRDLDTANAHLKTNTLPDRIPYQSKVCGRCNFRKVCLPDLDFGQGAVLGDAELQTAVEQYVALKPQASAFEKVKKEIALTVKEKPVVIVGDHVITGEWKERNIKAQEAKPAQVQRYWGWDVESKETVDA